MSTKKLMRGCVDVLMRFRCRYATNFICRLWRRGAKRRLQHNPCPKGTPLKAHSPRPTAHSYITNVAPSPAPQMTVSRLTSARLMSFDAKVFRHKCRNKPPAPISHSPFPRTPRESPGHSPKWQNKKQSHESLCFFVFTACYR